MTIGLTEPSHPTADAAPSVDDSSHPMRTYGAERALDLIRLPWILVDFDKRVRSLNEEARLLLDAFEPLRVVNGVLVASDTGIDRMLRREIDAACSAPAHVESECSGRPRMVPILGLAGEQSVLATVTPFALANGDEIVQSRTRGWALIILYGARTPTSTDLEPIASRFGWTAAETLVCAALLAGRSVAEISVERGGSVATVRTHVKNLLQKTGTRSQSKLIALLAPLLVVAPPVTHPSTGQPARRRANCLTAPSVAGAPADARRASGAADSSASMPSNLDALFWVPGSPPVDADRTSDLSA